MPKTTEEIIKNNFKNVYDMKEKWYSEEEVEKHKIWMDAYNEGMCDGLDK